MSKFIEMATKKLVKLADQVARETAGNRCPYNFNQPKVPTILQKKK